MARLWEADVEISREEAVHLIEQRFPALAPAQLEPFGVGWDNLAFLVNGHLVFRFPRRKIAAGLIEYESCVLPLLAPRLPLPIPVPTFVGRSDGDYPYPFAGYALIPGITACRVNWTDTERERTAAPLARFLAALHGIAVGEDTRAWAPRDDIERANVVKRAPRAKEWLHAIAPRLRAIDIGALLDLVDRLTDTSPYTGPLRWVHGDLYARHLLVDADHRLCGVIDWGDVHLGDPALDLSIAFSFLPPTAHEAFRAGYGSIDNATWDRARFRALHYGAILVDYGAEVGDDAIRTAGEYALHATAS